jgi:hypothetical protein
LFKKLLVFIIALLSLVPSVLAQESPKLDTLVIDLWPEYDRPSVLVIYKAVISPDVSLPTEIKFRIPIEAGKPYVVAVGPDAATVADVVYETQVMGDWLEVSFIATTPAIQFEYYDPGLSIEGVQRTFEYIWPGDHAVDSLDLRVQHPLGATDVSITPNMGKVIQDSDGFLYSVIEVGSLEQDSHFEIGISYRKESQVLSIESLQIQPSATIIPATSSLLDLEQWWVWLLVVLAVVLIAGGGYWYWRLGREETPSKDRRRRRASRQETSEIFQEGAIYCHQCGKRAESGDRYCRSCGTRLRIE